MTSLLISYDVLILQPYETTHIYIVFPTGGSSHQVECNTSQDKGLDLENGESSLHANLGQCTLASDQLTDDGSSNAQHCTQR